MNAILNDNNNNINKKARSLKSTPSTIFVLSIYFTVYSEYCTRYKKKELAII